MQSVDNIFSEQLTFTPITLGDVWNKLDSLVTEIGMRQIICPLTYYKTWEITIGDEIKRYVDTIGLTLDGMHISYNHIIIFSLFTENRTPHFIGYKNNTNLSLTTTLFKIKYGHLIY